MDADGDLGRDALTVIMDDIEMELSCCYHTMEIVRFKEVGTYKDSLAENA